MRFTAFFLINPIFFQEITQGKFLTVSVVCERYTANWKNKVIPHLQENKVLHSITFMQDGSPPYITFHVTTILRSTFEEDRVLTRSCPPQ